MSKYNHAILLAGYSASGKSTALDVMKGFGNIFCFEMSSIVRSLYESESSKNIDDNSLGDWASRLKGKHGNGFFARQLLLGVEEEVPATKSVAVSGIRSPEEVQAFIESDLFDEVTLVSVVANESTRWERYSERDGASEQKFIDRNVREEDWGVDNLIKFSDVWLNNSYTTEERFRNKVKMITKSILENDDHDTDRQYNSSIVTA